MDMKEKTGTKNFVKLTFDQNLLLINIDERLKKQRQESLIKLSESGTQISPKPERTETVTSYISPYLNASAKAI